MFHRSTEKALALMAALLIISTDSAAIGETSYRQANKLFAATGEATVLNVYNWDDYIAPDEKDAAGTVTEKGLIAKFEDYCLEKGQNVKVNYSVFDTNETMLSELKTGKAQYDLICPSDYVIQKMISEELIVPYGTDSTPNYDKYVSPYIKSKINTIEVGDKKVSDYARGYMWGTLGILYNDNYQGCSVPAKEMDADMTSWLSLWDSKYKNLLSIKDAMRDTYEVGIMKTYDQDFSLEGKHYDGFSTLKSKYDKGELTDVEYNEKVSVLFNLCDDVTIGKVGDDLKVLKDNAFGFEVDSGKTDMASGNKFAINVAWSGDAAYAMDQADEINESKKEGERKTILKYSLPETGANIWFDGWVIPKNVQHKELAEEFVDFLSTPSISAQNMNYIGYTSVIAGDDILSLIQSWYDLRWDENLNDGEGGMDENLVNDYTLVNSKDISSLTDEEKAASYYQKDISYFFEGTLNNHNISEAVFCLTADTKDRQFDTQYPDSTKLPGLAVMADFGSQNASVLIMWENVKNTALPLWSYIVIAIVVVLLIALAVFNKIRRKAVLRKRRERKENRALKAKVAK